jgi:hypothetical protein
MENMVSWQARYEEAKARIAASADDPWRLPLERVRGLATRGYFKPMRIAGAQARRVLIDAVAAKKSGAPRFLCSDQAKRDPVEIGIPPSLSLGEQDDSKAFVG